MWSAVWVKRNQRGRWSLPYLPEGASSRIIFEPSGLRTPPPDRPRPIGMHPGPPLTEPSSSTTAPSVPAPLLAQYTPALSPDRWKVNLLLRSLWAQAKAQPKAPKGMTPLWLKILPFSPLPNKKVRTLSQGERKARIRARTKVAIKARAKAEALLAPPAAI